jgi:hypothetical protein
MAEQETKERQMLPEVQAYIDATEAADKADADGGRALHEKYRKYCYDDSDEGYEQRRAFRKERSALWSSRDEAREAAWAALKESSDPLVKWIAENCADYRDQAETILRALPATAEELDAIAEEHDWCGVWNGFRDQAADAGVLPGVKPLTPARRAVFDQIHQDACCALEGGGRRRIGAALDALVAEALEAAQQPA